MLLGLVIGKRLTYYLAFAVDEAVALSLVLHHDAVWGDGGAYHSREVLERYDYVAQVVYTAPLVVAIFCGIESTFA